MFNIDDLSYEVQKWIKEPDEGKKSIIKKRCLYDWASVVEYSKTLDDNNIVSTKIFDEEIIEKIKKISDQCKTNIEFNDSENICKHINDKLVIFYI